MTDARLVATNPADSTLVPVACTPEGFIKIDSDYDPGVITGDLSVSGDVTIGLTLDVTGNSTFSSAQFSSAVNISAGSQVDVASSTAYGTQIGAYSNAGQLVLQATDTSSIFTEALLVYRGVTKNVSITNTGNANFSGNVTAANINAANITAFKDILESGISTANDMEDIKQLIITAISLL